MIVSLKGNGMQEIELIVSLIDRALMAKDDANTLTQVKKEVNLLMQDRPLFTW